MGENYGNLINGVWRPAGTGQGFVIADAEGEELERRMRAEANDLEEALAVLEGGCQAWWEQGVGGRGEILDSLDLSAETQRCAAGIAARIGLSLDEADGLLKGDLEDLEELENLEVEAAPAPGVALVRCAPVALLSGLTSQLVQALERGWSVLLLADPELPWIAELLADAWVRAGAPVDVLALLHDDGASCARAALSSGRLSSASICDLESRLGVFEAKLEIREGAGSGLGAARGGGLAPSFYGIPLRDATSVVTSDCDPAEEAFAVVEAAFGSALALGGEREGSIGRVVCHERQFSAFTHSLLEAFDALEQRDGPLMRPLLPQLNGWMTELSQAAGGEGGTTLRGGSSGSNERGGRGKMGRSVFTNLGPNWSFARAGRPAPAISLFRAPDDEKAQELALACDAGPPQSSE